MADINNPPGSRADQQPPQPDQNRAASYTRYGYGYMPYGPTSDWQSGGELDIATLLRVLWRRKLTFVLMTVFVVLSAVFYLKHAVPVYESKCTIELSMRRPRILSQQEAVINDMATVSASDMLNTQMLKLQGSSLRKTVLERIRAMHPNLVSTNDEQMLKFLEGSARIELIRRSSLIKITVASTNATLATDIANMYAHTAVSNSFAVNKDASDNAVAWLQTQVVAQRKTLQRADEAILAFNKQNQIETLISLRKTAEDAMLTYNKELAEGIATRESALAKYTQKHPEVRALDQLIESTRNQLDAETQRVRELDLKITEAKSRLNALQRDSESCEINYKGMLHRMEEARLSADEKTTTVKIVEPAEIPTNPVRPRKARIIVLSVACGLFLGALLALLTHRLENRIWNPDEVAQEMGLTLLGAIPHATRKQSDKLAQASHLDKFGNVAESFAAVRAVIDADRKIKTILVTSSVAGEGKTVSCCNLAISSAQSGLKTLLVDLDMRRPKLRKMFNLMVTGKNIFHVQVLADESTQDFAALPVQSAIPNLSIIPTIPSPTSPAEILGSKRVQKFMDWASENFDRVLIDSPPVSAASDAMLLGAVVNAVIFVCRFNISKKSMLSFSVRRLHDCGARIIGLIVNDIRIGKHGYYDGYHTYEGHHYQKQAPTVHT